MFQKVLEAPLEKKAGKNFGPPGNKKLIYFGERAAHVHVCMCVCVLRCMKRALK